MHLALVHDWLNQIGGAEDVLGTLVEMFPRVPVYTSMHWMERMPPAYRDWDIRVSWMDRPAMSSSLSGLVSSSRCRLRCI